jgi:uroporphyrin-3 C-methyltransferase
MNDKQTPGEAGADETRLLPTQAAEQKSYQPTEAPRKRGSGLAVFAALLSILALGASGYIWYHIQFTQQQKASDAAIGLTKIGSKIEQIDRDLDRVVLQQQGFVSRDNVELSIERNFDEVREQQALLEAAVNKINGNFVRGIDAWRLEEVEQLLRVANQGLALTGNRDAAIRALKLADEGLQSLADPRYTAVRLAIAADVGVLENSAVPDITGIASELIALAASVSGLPLINEPDGVTVEQPVIEVGDGTTWRTELRRLLNDLIGLVKIQKVDQSPRPLLAPEQRYFLEQNLQTMLYGAQLALLMGEYDLFHRNVEQAIDWVEAYFDTQQAVATSYLADLNRILATDLQSDNPDISRSMTAYQRVGSGGILE